LNRRKNEAYIPLFIGRYRNRPRIFLLAKVLEEFLMAGQAKLRKNADGTYKSTKGDAYKFDQWRFLERMKKFIEKKVRGK
jgi:hypothetical protein